MNLFFLENDKKISKNGKKYCRKIDSTGASRTVEHKLSIPRINRSASVDPTTTLCRNNSHHPCHCQYSSPAPRHLHSPATLPSFTRGCQRHHQQTLIYSLPTTCSTSRPAQRHLGKCRERELASLIPPPSSPSCAARGTWTGVAAAAARSSSSASPPAPPQPPPHPSPPPARRPPSAPPAPPSSSAPAVAAPAPEQRPCQPRHCTHRSAAACATAGA